MTRWSAQTRPLQRALQLLALSSFAIALPLFDLLGRHAVFFVAHRVGPGTILAFTILVVGGPPLALFTLSAAASVVSRRAGRLVHLVSVAALGALGLATVIVRSTGIGVTGGALAFVFFAAALALVYRKAWAFRALLTMAFPLVLAVTGMFLLTSPVRYLVFPPSFSAPGAEVQAASASTGVPPVFVLVLDELATGSIIQPDGSIDPRRYPGFARLSGGSTWYRNTTTVATSTDHAIPALLSGLRPVEPRIPFFSQYPQNLFTMLAVTHDLHISEFVTQLCHPMLCHPDTVESGGLREVARDAAIIYLHIITPPDTAARMLPPLGERWTDFQGEDPELDELDEREITGERRSVLVDALRERRHDHEGKRMADFLRENVRRTPGAKPGLWYLHLQIPHSPVRYLPTGQTYTGWGTLPGWRSAERRFGDDPYLATAMLQRSLVQTKYADVLVEELLDHLDEAGLYDETLLVVTSDHGASWEAGGEKREIQGHHADSTLWVPLFVKYPGQRNSQVDDSNVELIDVVPTIADVVGVEAPWVTEGSSLLDEEARRATKGVRTWRGLVEIEPDHRAPRRWASRIDSLFGPLGGPDDFFGFGEHRHLVGRQLSELQQLAGRGLVEVRGLTAFEDVDPAGRVLPAYVRGSLEGIDAERPVAVALNGAIAGVGRTYSEEEEVKLAVLLSPRHFVEGRNVLEVFVVEDDALRPLVVQDPS